MTFDATFSCLFQYNIFSCFLDNAMEMFVDATHLGRVCFSLNSIKKWKQSIAAVYDH